MIESKLIVTETGGVGGQEESRVRELGVTLTGAISFKANKMI